MKVTRLLACLVVAVASAFAFGQALGTKPDITTKSTVAEQPMVQPMDIAHMVLALVIVGGLLKWVLPKAIAKLGKRITGPVGSTIQIEESASFGAGQLQIVTVRGKTLLLCVTSQGVSNLADLTPSPLPLAADEPAFVDILESADPSKAIVTGAVTADDEDMSVDDAMRLIAQAKTLKQDSPLDRLNRLTQ